MGAGREGEETTEVTKGREYRPQGLHHHKNLDFYSEEDGESFGGVGSELTLHFLMISLPAQLRKTMREGERSRETNHKSIGMIKIRDISVWTKRAAVKMVKSGWIPNVIVKKQPQDLLTDTEHGCGKERGR